VADSFAVTTVISLLIKSFCGDLLVETGLAEAISEVAILLFRSPELFWGFADSLDFL